MSRYKEVRIRKKERKKDRQTNNVTYTSTSPKLLCLLITIMQF
jgi:uncharacterized membrane protein